MSYQVFQRMAKNVFARQGLQDAIQFKHEDGKHFARCGGATLTGCMGSTAIHCSWGSGHIARVPEEVCYNG